MMQPCVQQWSQYYILNPSSLLICSSSTVSLTHAAVMGLLVQFPYDIAWIYMVTDALLDTNLVLMPRIHI